MTIAEIKAALSITTVLARYGLEAGPKGAMRCPFHDDQSASMKIYTDTNTAYCFAGSCDVRSVDVIDFIMHKEKCDKRAAILKAKELCGVAGHDAGRTGKARRRRSSTLAAIYEESIAGMERTPSGKEYCDGAGSGHQPASATAPAKPKSGGAGAASSSRWWTRAV